MSDFIIGIGKRIKDIRKENNLTINELANRANVSNGLISRIENGRTIPSLPVLLDLIQSLDIDASYFFEGVENRNSTKYLYIPKENQQVIEKEIEAQGFKYMHIFSKSLNSLGFEAVLLTLEPNSKREKVITDAWEFKYILKGTVKYLIDQEEVILSEGDALYFNGRFPHVPVSISDESCIMLVLYLYSERD
ncbi:MULTISPECIES: helix-turn-helix domain-containing protein [Chryseobacterium]|uniref:helix-turn-helix domain-containing protein n=1 Tax=Chryseobacterium TaxID=59732 RepID=UPI000FA9FE5B|nr:MULTISPECIES: XRE family transcriptional regulator [Chryseobacterium]MBM7419483.1 transcriptional regulator with XRE-family HTH domain [Chryseobacterium sp. JUb44]MDH6209411.1 transcriptional regulator with XRE-family HTH domain [Chryseobacterium sp. BIGb0186]WSO12247.1 XRE family transcriptional regulator [Chryseobacterium scophthalmum]